MAVTGIRDYLKSKGLSDSDITYQNGAVMAKGQRFMDATPNADGVTTADNNTLDNTYNNYDMKNQLATLRSQATAPNPEITAYNQALKERISKPITPFTYDSNTDQAFQAQKSMIAQDTTRDMNNAKVEVGASGMRGGSLQNIQLMQLSAKYQNQLQNQALPAAQAAAYQRYQGQNQLENQQTGNMMQFGNTLNAQDQQRFGNQTQILGMQNNMNQQETDNQYRDKTFGEQQKQNNYDAYAKAVAMTGNLGTGAKSDYNLLGSTDGPLSMQGRDQALQETQVNAKLTGKMPDGTPTTEEQQRRLTNEWKYADSQGVVGETLGSMYGIPANTPTMQAKHMASQLAISQQNANTSASSAASSAANARASQSLNERKFQAEQDPNSIDNRYKVDQMQSKEDQTMYDNGLKAYKETGEMPTYMDKYGINVKGLKNEKTKAEVQGLYGELSSGKLLPEDALKTINDAAKLGLKDPEVIDQLRATIYLQFPEYDPAEIEKKKAESAKTSKFGFRMFGG